MITMAIAVAAGLLYWLGMYKLAFWILLYAITYGSLVALRGQDERRAIQRRDAALTIAVLIPVTWHVAALAGYL
jgi:hypothetical protein